MTDSTPTIPPLYFEVFALTQAGDFQQALDRLDTAPVLLPRVHHRQRGYALHNLFRYPEAHLQMFEALNHSEGEARGAVYADWAVMYMREQRHEEGYRCYHQALALMASTSSRAVTLYNLSWTYLRQLQLQHARQYLEEAQLLIRRTRDAEARWWLTFVRCALALHARIEGDVDLALERAAQAVKSAPGDRAGVFAWHTLAATQRLSGDLEAALASQTQALALAGEGQASATETLHLRLIALQGGDADEQELAGLVPLVAPYDAWRARLHLAQSALQAGREAEALTTLRAALDAREPYVLLDEASVLTDLYTFGRGQGLAVPKAAGSRPRRLHLLTRGVTGAELCGHRLPLDNALSIGVLLYLHLEGPVRMDTLVRALLDTDEAGAKRGAARLRTAVDDVSYWTGSDRLLQRSVAGVYTLGPAWTVSSDAAPGEATGRVLPDLYGAWVQELQRRG